jgi:uncharacterized protein
VNTKHRPTDLVVPVGHLLKQPGSTTRFEREAVLDDLAISSSRVPEGEPLVLDVELQAVNDGIIVVGTVKAPWTGECRRCLQPARGEVAAEVQEVFERDPVEGETRKLAGVEIDLAELARDSVLLELPLAPLCRDDCAGLCPQCGADRNQGGCECVVDTKDLRWAALEQVRFDQ